MLYQLSYTHHGRRAPAPARTSVADTAEPSGASAVAAGTRRVGRRRVGLRRRGASYFAAMRSGVSVSGPGCGHEQRLPVVLQLLDALADVGQRPVAAALLGGGEVDPRVPAAGQLLDRRDVDDPVVQVVSSSGMSRARKPRSVADRVARQRRLAPARARTRGCRRAPAFSASASVMPASSSSSSPDACASRGRRPRICSSASSGGRMTTSTPSPSTFSSESVTSAATSTSASRRGRARSSRSRSRRSGPGSAPADARGCLQPRPSLYAPDRAPGVGAPAVASRR